jgi:hypothetical protein
MKMYILVRDDIPLGWGLLVFSAISDGTQS